MAKPPDCSHCQKPATIHLTQINNNQIKKLDFCETCPHQKGVTDPTGFSLTDLLAQSDPGSSGSCADATCKTCGFTPHDFKKHARLGCPDCYQHLAEFIEPMLERMHRGTEHCGKAPEELLARLKLLGEIEETSTALEVAVQDENFEEAARLRDQLKALQTEQQSGSVSLG